MNYKAQFENAYHRSSEIGLEPGYQVLPFGEKLSDEKIQNILQICADFLYSIGLEGSSQLAGKCIPVHLQLQDVLREHLSVESHITVGDRYWEDYIYCEMSYKAIMQELKNPDVGVPLKAHVWLTLHDGSVLDCTGEAHMDLLRERGEHPAHECIAFISSDATVSDGYYRPYLVGSDFLKKTGAFCIIPA